MVVLREDRRCTGHARELSRSWADRTAELQSLVSRQGLRMQIFVNALLVMAAIAMVAGYLWLLAASFREHIGWGAFVLLLPPLGSVAFMGCHRNETWS